MFFSTRITNIQPVSVKEWSDSFSDIIDITPNHFVIPKDSTKLYYGTFKNNKFRIARKNLVITTGHTRSKFQFIICKGRIRPIYSHKTEVAIIVSWTLHYIGVQIIGLLIGSLTLINGIYFSETPLSTSSLGLLICVIIIMFNRLTFNDYKNEYLELLNKKIIQHKKPSENKINI